MFGRKGYSRRKARKLLKHKESLLRRRRKRLTPEAKEEVAHALDELHAALKEKSDPTAAAEKVEQVSNRHLRKSGWDYARETVIAIVVALLVATIVRQMWFEPMEIPSGSMRPTFRERDRLIVSKDTFGLNVPLKPAHFLFEPQLMKRHGVFIFTSEDMDIPDQDTLYFGLPGKKRLVKRVMGLPGDTLYFYGGKIWGIDAEGNPIEPFTLEHIPFITLAGKTDHQGKTTLFRQMNQELGRLTTHRGSTTGEIFNGSEWIPDRPYLANNKEIHTYSDFYGSRNYAMARLLTSEELATLSEAPLDNVGEGALYLELRHHASLTYPKPLVSRDRRGLYRPMLNPEVSVIPVQQGHLDRIMDAMTTSRFIVEDERAYPELDGHKELRTSPYRSLFPGIPDGRYELIDGKGYSVGFGGILKELPADHPLLAKTPENIQRLYNLGVEVLAPFAPYARDQVTFPSRFAYFNKGELSTLGQPIFTTDDPLLATFHKNEADRASRSTPSRPYLPFKDYGPPLTESGELDTDFLATFGLKIPPKSYLALGDNYASSSDSRAFGFVPEENVRGTPAVILWPPGPRLGTTPAPRYPIFTLPRLIVWGIFLLCILAYISWRRATKR